MSSMRSASSITSSRVSVSSSPPRSNMSISRPGVAISTSTPRISSVLLVGHAFAADEQGVVQLQVLAVLDEVLGDLEGEFARRLQDQAARHAGAGAGTGEDVEHRQGEAGGLAGAGLRHAQHVAAHQHDRDRLFLDRRGRQIAFLGDRSQDRLGQTKISEAFWRIGDCGLLISHRQHGRGWNRVVRRRRRLRGGSRCGLLISHRQHGRGWDSVVRRRRRLRGGSRCGLLISHRQHGRGWDSVVRRRRRLRGGNRCGLFIGRRQHGRGRGSIVQHGRRLGGGRRCRVFIGRRQHGRRLGGGRLCGQRLGKRHGIGQNGCASSAAPARRRHARTP